MFLSNSKGLDVSHSFFLHHLLKMMNFQQPIIIVQWPPLGTLAPQQHRWRIMKCFGSLTSSWDLGDKSDRLQIEVEQ